MSAGFDINFFGNKGGKTNRRCSVVAIYEDLGNRQMLLELSDSLARKFKNDVEFRFDWCRFKYLADPEIAKQTARSAAQADLILLAPKSPDLPAYVQGWFEGWAPNRESGDGALVLVQPPPKGASRSLPLQSYLRLTAKRAHLDYLRLHSPGVAVGATRSFAGLSLSQCELDEILVQNHRPLDGGINE
jgi:hypothetical protein